MKWQHVVDPEQDPESGISTQFKYILVPYNFGEIFEDDT